jgi:hypothetical protein
MEQIQFYSKRNLGFDWNWIWCIRSVGVGGGILFVLHTHTHSTHPGRFYCNPLYLYVILLALGDCDGIALLLQIAPV